MNREILFRAKKVDNDEWVYGYVIKRHGLWFLYDLKNSDTFRQKNYEVRPDTICQYTGLTNELGEEFLENDIVQCGYYYGVIKYEDDAFIIKWNTKGSEFLRHDLAYWAYLRNARVVGNIFDNPELLEGVHDA